MNKLNGLQLSVYVEGMEYYCFRERKVNLVWDLTMLVEEYGIAHNRVQPLLVPQDPKRDTHIRLENMAETYVLFGGYGLVDPTVAPEDREFMMYVSDEGYDILFAREFGGLDEETGVETITLKVFGFEVR